MDAQGDLRGAAAASPAGSAASANRSPLTQALQLEEIRTHRWCILRCSAMTGQNLKEGLAWVVEDAKARLFLY